MTEVLMSELAMFEETKGSQMIITPPIGAADMLTLIEAYAEARHRHSRYNAQTATAKQTVKDALAQCFDAADMATAAAQGFRDGVASVSAGIEPVAMVGSDFGLYWVGNGPADGESNG